MNSFEDLKNKVFNNRNNKTDEKPNNEKVSTFDDLKTNIRNNQNAKNVDRNYINNFLNQYNDFFSSAEKDYNQLGWGNASATYDTRYKTSTELNSSKGAIESWFKSNSNQLDDQSKQILTDILGSYDKDMSGIMNAFKSAKDYYGQWDSEDAYQRDYSLNEQYGDLSYDELMGEMEYTDDNYTREWLTHKADSIATKDDYSNTISRNQEEIEKLEEMYDVASIILDSMQNSGNDSAEYLEQQNAQLQDALGPYKNLKDLEAKINQLKNDTWNTEKKLDYNYLEENADFSKLSKPSTENTSGFGLLVGNRFYGKGDAVYDYINDINGERARRAKDESDGELKKYANMSADEIARYNYIHNTQGKKAAGEYLDYLEPELDKEFIADINEEVAAYASREAGNASVLSTFATMASGIGFLDAAAQKFSNGIKEAVTGEYAGPVNYNSKAMIASNTATTIRKTVSENLADKYGRIEINAEKHPLFARLLNGKSWGDVYQLGMSMVDSSVVAVLSTVVGPGAAFLLGGSAATQGMLDAIANGATDEQALMMGLLNGTFETIFEKYEVEHLLGADTNLLKAIFNQAITESIGEGATSIANTFADIFVMAENSQFYKLVAEYESQGLEHSTAIIEAIKDTAIQIGWDAVGGLLMGGVSGGGASIFKSALGVDNATQTTSGIDQTNIEQIDSFVPQGNVNVGSEKNNPTIKSADQKQTAEQSKQTQNEPVKHDPVKMESAAKRRLEALGETENVDTIANLAARRASGEELKRSEITTLAHSQFGAKVAKELAENKLKIDTQETEATKAKATEHSLKDAVATSIDGNTMTVKLADGTVVDSTDMELDDYDQSTLVATVPAIEHITHEAATVAMNGYDPASGVEVSAYVSAFDEAYTYGFNSYSMERLSQGKFAPVLSAEQMQRAYELGREARRAEYEDADTDKETARKKSEEGVTEAEKTAKLRERFVNGKSNVYFMDGTNVTEFDENQKYTDRQKSAVKVAQFFTKMGIGGRYVFFRSEVKNGRLVFTDINGVEKNAPNGIYRDSTGTIYIDMNAGDYGQGYTLFTLGHELTHFVKGQSKKQFAKLADYVAEAFDKTNRSMHKRVLDKQSELARLRGEDVSYDEAFEEVVADAMSTMIADENFYDKVMEIKAKDEGLYHTIRRFFKNLVARFVREYNKLTPDQQDARDIREMKDMFDKIQTAFAEALVEASENFHSAMESVVEADAKPMPTDQIVTEGAVVTDGNGERQSIRSMKHDIAEGKMFEDLKTVCGWTNAQVNTLRNQLNDLVEYMIPYRDILDMNEAYGMEGRRFSPYKPNSDPLYKISMDFSTLCSKRLLTQYVIENLQLRENRPMSAEEQMAIRSMLNEYRKVEKGLQVACAMCYVEAARLKSPKQIQRWMDDPATAMRNYFADKNSEFADYIKKAQEDFKESKGYDRNAPKKDMKPKDRTELNKIRPRLREQYELSAEEQAIVEKAKNLPNSTYLTAGNLANLSETDPVIYAAYTSFVRTATRSKSLETDEPYYYGDSTRDNGNGIVVTDSFIEAVNRENGMRFSSWSDWRIQHLLDYITAVIDNSVRGAAMHGYTKFGDEVRVLGKTGMMFNMSGVTGTQTGLNEDGSLNFSDTESIDVNEAIQLREEFPDTAGLQCIGVSNEHITALLRSDIIDYVIPYHVSGLNAALRRMADIHGWKDYTGTQNASIDKNAKLEDAVDKDHWHEEPVFSEFFVGYDTGMTGIEAMRESGKRYVQMCKDRGLVPKFEQFANEDNYWKLLIDRKMINQQTGNLIQQKAVTPTFDSNVIKGVVDKFVNNYDAGLESRALNHIVENWDTIPQKIKDLKKASKTKKSVDTLANQTVAAQPKDSGTKNSDRVSTGEKFSMRSAVEETADLVAFHNITPQLLMDVLNRKGLLMPSLAITNKGMTDFGEISLVFDKNTIDPSANSENKLYGADAWTPTQTQLKKNAKFDTNKTVNAVNNLKNSIGSEYVPALFNITAKQFKEAIIRADGSIYDAFAHSIGMQTAYAMEKGIISEIPTTKSGKVNKTALHEQLNAELDTDNGWRQYKRWLNNISDTVITSYDKASNEDILRNMKAQPASAKTFKLSENGELVVPAAEYSSIEDMRKNKNRLSENAAEETKAVADEFLALAKEIGNNTKSVVNAINVAFADRYNTSNIVKSFESHGIKISTETAGKLQEMYKKAVELPTQYFEAKPHREVGLNEIETVIMPKDEKLSELKSKLEELGISVTEYNADSKAERVKALNSVEKVKFSERATDTQKWKPNLDSTEWGIVNYAIESNQGKAITSTCNIFLKKSKGRTLFGIYSTDDSTLLYVSRGHTAEKESVFVDLLREEYKNGNVTDTSAEGLRAWAKTVRMQRTTNNDYGSGNVAPGRFEGNAELHGRQFELYSGAALRTVLKNIFKKETAGTTEDGRVMYSERGEGSSNRALIENAAKNVEEGSSDQRLIQRYQDNASKLDDLNRQLGEINSEIKNVLRGSKEAKNLSALEKKAETIVNEIDRRTSLATNLENSKGLQEIIQKELETRSERLTESGIRLQEEYWLKKEVKQIEALREYRETNAELRQKQSDISVMENEFVRLMREHEKESAKSNRKDSKNADKISNLKETVSQQKADLSTWKSEFVRLAKEYDKQQKVHERDEKTWGREFDRLVKEYEAAGRSIERLENKIVQQKENAKRIAKNRAESKERTELRHKIRKTIRDLDKILNRGNKKQNVKEDMKDFVSKALDIADYLFTDHISNDELIRRGITVRMTQKEAALVQETEEIIAKLDAATDINNPHTSLSDAQFAELDAKRKANEDKLRELLTAQRNERLSTPVYQLFDDLVNAYASLKNSNQEAVKAAYNEELEKSLRAFMSNDEQVKILKNMRVADMTTEELNWLYRAYTMVLTNVRKANEFFVKGMTESVDQVVTQLVNEFGKRNIPDKKVAIAAQKLSNKFGWNYEKLYYALDRIGSETFTKLMMNLANSENIVMADVIEAAIYRDRIVEKYGFNDWDINKKIDREFLDNNGKKFTMTLGEMMSLYAYSRRKGAWDHIEYGGFVFGKAALTNPKPADSYKLNKDQCEAITNLLTEEQKHYVEDMQKFLSETMGAKGNEVSMLLYGIKMFNESAYFPIHIAGDFMAKAEESQAKASEGFQSMSNAGFTHAQNPNAKAPFVLESFNEVWVDHVNEMSRYHGTVPALEDIRRVMNRSSYSESTAESTSVKAIMKNQYGEEAVQYFNDLYKEANSGAINDKLQQTSKKMLSLFRKNSVAYSLSVLVQQPAAIVRAYAMIDRRYFGVKGVGTISSALARGFTKDFAKSYNEMLKYAPGVTMTKEIGGFDTATGGSIRTYLLDTKKSVTQKWRTENAKGKAGALLDIVDNNPIANLPNLADKIAWIEIWNACKKETIAKHKDLSAGSEEFMQLVGDRFTEVIRATQVYDSIFAKSPMLKSKNLAVQYLVSFMNEPNTTANMAESAVRDIARGNWKQGLKKAHVVAHAIIFTGVMKSLIYAMRDDDEDETYIEKYIESLTGSLMDDFNPLNYIPIARDAWSIAQGYDVERADMAIVSDAIGALNNVIKIAHTSTENMTEEQLIELDKKQTEATWKLVEAIATCFGIPVKNVRREIKGLFNVARNTIPYDGITTGKSLSDKIMNAAIDSIPFMESKSKKDNLYDVILSGDAEYLERLKQTYKDDDAYHSAVRKALRDNDPRIREAAQAYYDGNIEEYKRIFRQIQNEINLFDFDDIMGAVMTEVSDIKGETEPKNESSDYSSADFVNAILVGDTGMAEDMMEDIIQFKLKDGKTQEEAEKSFAESVQNATRNAFDDDLLDDAGAKNMLLAYADMDEEEAEAKVEYWNFVKENPKYKEDFNQSRYEKYRDFAEPADIPLGIFVQYVNRTSGIETIKDEWGDEVMSVREQVLDVIDSLDLTWQQKDALYLAHGYAESKIFDVPW